MSRWAERIGPFLKEMNGELLQRERIAAALVEAEALSKHLPEDNHETEVA